MACRHTLHGDILLGDVLLRRPTERRWHDHLFGNRVLLCWQLRRVRIYLYYFNSYTQRMGSRP